MKNILFFLICGGFWIRSAVGKLVALRYPAGGRPPHQPTEPSIHGKKSSFSIKYFCGRTGEVITHCCMASMWRAVLHPQYGANVRVAKPAGCGRLGATGRVFRYPRFDNCCGAGLDGTRQYVRQGPQRDVLCLYRHLSSSGTCSGLRWFSGWFGLWSLCCVGVLCLPCSPTLLRRSGVTEDSHLLTPEWSPRRSLRRVHNGTIVALHSNSSAMLFLA